jgi:HrpA-like RNA helicase|eukprot:COSAG06_NODE_19_length_34432_cov_10.651832_9_plen_66_part_00
MTPCPEDILRHIKHNRVTIIQGETGRGKSSRLPHMLIQAGGPRVKMMVAQPRRTAAHSDSLMERK